MANEGSIVRIHPIDSRSHLRALTHVLGVLVFSLSSGYVSGESEPPTAAPLTSWHDGRQTRGLWLDPTREAEFPSRGGGTVQP